jgi:predicted XRE-type DNA-binding protein
MWAGTPTLLDFFRATRFFGTESGNEPVREWLKSLPVENRKQIDSDILAVQWAWPVGKPLVDSLGSGLWEISIFAWQPHHPHIFPNRKPRNHPAARDFEKNENCAKTRYRSGKKAPGPIPEKHLMKTKPTNKHRGSDLKGFLAEENILPEVEALAMKKAIALQLQRIVEEESISKTQLAKRMKTSRAALDRILDASTPSLSIGTLAKAAAALGRRVSLQILPA